MDYDSSWCPVCRREIIPKHNIVQLPHPSATAINSLLNQQSPEQSPAAPPSSPTSRSKKSANRRLGGGLVAGTGGLRRTASKRTTQQQQPALVAVAHDQKPTKLRHRVEISQSPLPLYCSEKCRLDDIAYCHGSLPGDYDPRHHPAQPTRPSLSKADSDTASTSSSSSSESSSSSDTSDYASSERPERPISPSLAVLSKAYGWGPLPTFPSFRSASPPPSAPPTIPAPRFTAGCMMALPPAPAPTTKKSRTAKKPEQTRPAGWHSPTQTWRAAVYSMSAAPPAPHASLADIRGYGSLDATSGPRRSRAGVVSSLPEHDSAPTSAPCTAGIAGPARRDSDASLLSAFQSPFARRSESRASLFSSSSPPTSASLASARSLPAASPSSWTERPLLPPAAQGKLLVPAGAKLRVRRGSDSHTGSSSSAKPVRSPLGGSVFSEEEHESECCDTESESEECEEWRKDKDRTIRVRDSTRPRLFGQGAGAPQQGQAQTRSWSYEAVPTLKLYPVMRMPGKRLFNFSEVPV